MVFSVLVSVIPILVLPRFNPVITPFSDTSAVAVSLLAYAKSPSAPSLYNRLKPTPNTGLKLYFPPTEEMVIEVSLTLILISLMHTQDFLLTVVSSPNCP